MKAKYYAAPLEGVTYGVWRNAQRQIFGGADRYYAPFFAPNNSENLQTKDLRELTQGEPDLVPQVLTNRSDYFLWAARTLKEMGYSELNFNLGCPSGTVVAKHKGSGALREPAALDHLLEEIFAGLPAGMALSVKTRIGLNSPEEWPALLEVFERYPICDLTIHPRLQCELYNGSAHRELFLQTMAETKLPLVYNGDIRSPSDPAFSYGCGIMAGRGLVANPALFRQAQGGTPAGRDELCKLHELLLEGYAAYMPGQVPLLHRMKEFWQYFAHSFGDTTQPLKQLRKAKTLSEYHAAADCILRTCPTVQPD